MNNPETNNLPELNMNNLPEPNMNNPEPVLNNLFFSVSDFMNCVKMRRNLFLS